MYKNNLVSIVFAVPILFGIAFGEANAILPEGMIHHWAGEGNADDTVGGADGTEGASSAYDLGKSGQAFSFDGQQSSIIQLPVNINPSAYPKLTMGMWINMRSNNNDRGWVIGHDNSGFDRSINIQDIRYDEGVAGGTGLAPHSSSLLKLKENLDTWHCIAVSYDQDQSTATFYADGVTQTVDASNGEGLATTTLGGLTDFLNHTVDALVDEVFIFDRALDAQEIDNVCETLGSPIKKEITSGPVNGEGHYIAGEFVKIEGGIVNGSFEDACNNAATFDTLSAGSTLLDDWTIDSGSIDHICGAYWWGSDGSGSKSVDLSGGGSGVISQSFTTEPGRKYQIRFSMAGNTDGGDTVKDLSVSVDNSTSTFGIFSFDTANDCGGSCLRPGNMGWTEKTLAFTATAAVTKVTFESLENNPFGPALDDVMLFIAQQIDRAVTIKPSQPYKYDFTVTVKNPAGDEIWVHDTLPAEWILHEVNGELIGMTGGNYGGDGVDACGEFDTVEDVTASKGGKLGKKCHSSTKIKWTTSTQGINSYNFLAWTRESPGKGHTKRGGDRVFAPTSCGALYLNDGAHSINHDTGEEGWTEPLVLAAIPDSEDFEFDGSGDYDEDGLTDIEEVTGSENGAYNHEATEPCNDDSDNDGLSDGAEINTHGTDPNDSDTDGDGYSDGAEVNTHGTDPLDSASHP